tara:strand:- start:33 stop:281 length:249 start_codon:yes stop_codon:yes gene_type:complete
MNVLKYLESKGIKDNPRIIDVTGQATDFYLQTLLEDFKKQLTLTDVSQQRELLIAFTEWITIDVYETKNEIERDVDMYLSNL